MHRCRRKCGRCHQSSKYCHDETENK